MISSVTLIYESYSLFSQHTDGYNFYDCNIDYSNNDNSNNRFRDHSRSIEYQRNNNRHDDNSFIIEYHNINKAVDNYPFIIDY